jgi:hypothetical protein
MLMNVMDEQGHAGAFPIASRFKTPSWAITKQTILTSRAAWSGFTKYRRVTMEDREFSHSQ